MALIGLQHPARRCSTERTPSRRGRRAIARVWLLAAVCLLGTVAAASAQTGSGIAGVVKDASGGVLPGVTVEAASPAMIGGNRTAVTDGNGQYKIIDLRPGDYTVTFVLAGFRTGKRDGITLPASFTATVNVDLAVGQLEEVLTVTSAAPLVDVKSSLSEGPVRPDRPG